jgi:hypothetical protein
MLSFVEIMKNVMKINQYQIDYKLYGYKIKFNNLKYTKTCSFHIKQNDTSKKICNHDV